jgi:hypothetical protein
MEAGPVTGAEWLAQADPALRLDDWLSLPAGLAMLPAGRVWDAVVMPFSLGWHVRRALGFDLGGPPLMHDLGCHRLYFLVPPGTATTWDAPPTRCLGVGSWLAVPHPAGVGGPAACWLSSPDGSGALYDPDVLRAAVVHARAAPRKREFE